MVSDALVSALGSRLFAPEYRDAKDPCVSATDVACAWILHRSGSLVLSGGASCPAVGRQSRQRASAPAIQDAIVQIVLCRMLALYTGILAQLEILEEKLKKELSPLHQARVPHQLFRLGRRKERALGSVPEHDGRR